MAASSLRLLQSRLLPYSRARFLIWSSSAPHQASKEPLMVTSYTLKERNFHDERLNAYQSEQAMDQASKEQVMESSTPTNGTKKGWSFLKFCVFSALTGGVGVASYATYACTLEEVEQKTAALRNPTNYTVDGDGSIFNKMQASLYNAAVTVPAKSIQLYLDLRKSIEDHVKEFTEPSSEKLLPDILPIDQHKFTLVLDLNETLVYSDWKRERGWRTFKRPGVDDFLEHLAPYYEIVVYSDQQSVYVDPIISRLDQKGLIRYRLSRAETKYVDGKHYRDFCKLNRDSSRVLYVSGHALENSLQPENCVPIKPWKLESDDTQLLDLIPFLEYVGSHKPADIKTVLETYQGCDIAKEFLERSRKHQSSTGPKLQRSPTRSSCRQYSKHTASSFIEVV
ncbi:mitochondrial import inner membrane translocase subunit TIM50 isoform X3 [Amborella trichopoda]|uniref:mitochondrial import inner membrane translocase subunit TIM50 isoform X3 n=1 Tax=Amborella trichopoda TaxID=13333 RepID=UPI0009BF9741|nr:mitochondrial import inner membrane translocase subunit TIM50 isoform X3 [Amborella trichopoda]|eukprot:XP_020517194.1 mitochondrial import inner membrane translocase subunit TIM50 isoform X3 [Amborella trichopoda]